jgi:hypothetical protein
VRKLQRWFLLQQMNFFANTQQYVKSALHAKIFSSLLAAMLAAVKMPL